MVRDLIERVKNFYSSEHPFSELTLSEFDIQLKAAFETRQYFSLGKNSVVVPGWILEQLAPGGKAKHGLAALPIISNNEYRDYYAVGSPDSSIEPVIDHRGGIIPKPDSYTLVVGTIVNDKPIYSSEAGKIDIQLHDDGFPIVMVNWKVDGDECSYECVADRDEEGVETLAINVVRGFANHQLLLTLTPLDQVKLTRVETLEWMDKSQTLIVNGKAQIKVSEKPLNAVALPIERGHAGRWVNKLEPSHVATCKSQAASWAVRFPVRTRVSILVNLTEGQEFEMVDSDDVEDKWIEEIENFPIIHTGDPLVDTLFKNSAITLRLLLDKINDEITLGPSLQEEMWPQCLYTQIKAIHRLGVEDSTIQSIIDNALSRVNDSGTINDLNEWDALGSLVLSVAISNQFTNDTNWLGEKFSIIKKIIENFSKLRKKNQTDDPRNVLLPAGTQAFYDPIFKISDQFFYHNMWALKGIEIFRQLALKLGRKNESEAKTSEIQKYRDDLNSLMIQSSSTNGFVTLGPKLQENASMFFNLHSFYPLRLHTNNFQPLINTLNQISKEYVVDGGLLMYQPWNAYGTYLTMQYAQMLRYVERTEKIKNSIDFLIKNPTNKQGWGEGISPNRNSASVGDSPNGYAAAEFINLIVDLFVDEPLFEDITLLKGIPLDWLKNGVEAQNLHLSDGDHISLKASLTANIFELEYDYSGNKPLFLYLPLKPERIDKTLTQTSPDHYKLPSNKGSVKIPVILN